jgi:uncharacterized protein (DUF58 family)
VKAAALGVALCLLAAAFAVPSLYVPGAALILLAWAAHLIVNSAARNARVVRTPERATVEELTSLQLLVRLERTGARPLRRTGELESWPGAEPVELNRIPRGGAVEVNISFARRGRHELGPARARFADPLGICAREVTSAPTEVLVLPRVERLRGAVPGRLAEPGRSAGRRTSSLAGDVDSLRPYRPGAPASRIHWPTVARTGVLMERRLRSESERRPLIVVDSRAPASEEALDSALRAAASLCVRLGELGGCALLLPGERRSHVIEADLGAWPALHARLALVEPSSVAPLWSAVERAAIVVWVSGGETVAAPMLRRRAAGAIYTVTPFPMPGREVLIAVAGCVVQLLRGTGAMSGRAA